MAEKMLVSKYPFLEIHWDRIKMKGYSYKTGMKR